MVTVGIVVVGVVATVADGVAVEEVAVVAGVGVAVVVAVVVEASGLVGSRKSTVLCLSGPAWRKVKNC